MAMELSAQNFDKEVLQAPGAVLVDFWAAWCGPCKMLGPVVEQVAKEYGDKIKVCKVNVDEASDVAGRYGVMSIPTLIVFQNGKIAKQTVGAMPKEKLIDFIRPFFSEKK